MARAETSPAANRWVLLVVVMVGTFISILDSLAMNVALPSIMTAFGANVEQANRIRAGFLTAAAVSMPLTHWLGRRFGYGRLFIGCLAVFTGGAALSSSAWSLHSLGAFRIVQGVGAGIIQPAAIALITRAFPPGIRGRALGVWSVGAMLGPSLGPTAGGWLIDVFSWRAVFTMSVFVGVFALVLAAVVLDRTQDEEPVPFDWLGYGCLSTFLVVALATLANGREAGWSSGPVLLGGAVAVTALMLLLVLEWDAPHPIVPLRLYRIPDFSLSLFISFYKSLARAGSGFSIPIFLHQLQGRQSLQIGLLLMPGAIVNTVCGPIAGVLTDRFGGRWLSIVGGCLIAFFFFSYHKLDLTADPWMIVYPQLFRGIGIALIDTPVVTTGMNAVSREEAGHASWMLNLGQRVGSALSISMLSTLLQRGIVIQQDHLGQTPLAHRAPPSGEVRQAMALGLRDEEAKAAVAALTRRHLRLLSTTLAFQNLFVLCGLLSITVVVPSFLLARFKAPPRRAVV